MSDKICIVIRPREGDGRTAGDRVKALAEYVAGLLGPVAVRREGPSQPPYEKDDPTRFQLDQGNDWFLNGEEEAGGVVQVQISHRYGSAEKVAAVRAMICLFTGYEVVGP